MAGMRHCEVWAALFLLFLNQAPALGMSAGALGSPGPPHPAPAPLESAQVQGRPWTDLPATGQVAQGHGAFVASRPPEAAPDVPCPDSPA